MSIILAPSILGGPFSNMEKIIKDFDQSEASYIHLDVMDGDFVPNLTFGPKFISDIRKYTSKTFDVHLMINRVDKFLQDYINAGSDIITFHIEVNENIESNLQYIKSKGLKSGLAIKPDTNWDTIIPFIHLIDQALVMTVEPGFGGQSFMNNQLLKVEEIKKLSKDKNLTLDIGVDGGIDDLTGPLCINAGANVLIAGSYLFKQENLISATNELNKKFHNV
ncbi:MAG: ribulose-phosphate 3-epimerase [Alphaproteobacteria bacterium]|jgi:ribulose-phosphate 3-epimerase|nr:ribulose-phosphate 3-epimerase [Alphaproteobacteria bacterium]